MEEYGWTKKMRGMVPMKLWFGINGAGTTRFVEWGADHTAMILAETKQYSGFP